MSGYVPCQRGRRLPTNARWASRARFRAIFAAGSFRGNQKTIYRQTNRWFPLGPTPLKNVKIPNGYVRWRVSKRCG